MTIRTVDIKFIDDLPTTLWNLFEGCLNFAVNIFTWTWLRFRILSEVAASLAIELSLSMPSVSPLASEWLCCEISGTQVLFGVSVHLAMSASCTDYYAKPLRASNLTMHGNIMRKSLPKHDWVVSGAISHPLSITTRLIKLPVPASNRVHNVGYRITPYSQRRLAIQLLWDSVAHWCWYYRHNMGVAHKVLLDSCNMFAKIDNVVIKVGFLCLVLLS